MSQTAEALAKALNLPPETQEKAALAGLLHDAAKLLTPPELSAKAEQYGVTLSEEDRRNPQVLHAKVAPAYVQEALGIDDPEVLNAIAAHTTGHGAMSPLELIVYVADKIEPRTRDPHWVGQVMAGLTIQSQADLEEATLRLLESSLRHLLDRRKAIHPDTLNTWNTLLSRRRQTFASADTL